MQRFDFAIRTRSGQRIGSVVIAGQDRADAERKLNQMYRYCSIERCDVREPGGRAKPPPASMEDLLTLISK